MRRVAPSAALLHSADRRDTLCAPARPDWAPRWGARRDLLAAEGSCTDLEHGKVLCAHGDGLETDKGECPAQLAPAGEHVRRAARWQEGVTVVVPAYPWPENIFHFANVATSLVAVVHALPTLVEAWGEQNWRADAGQRYFESGKQAVGKVHVVFRGSKVLIDRNLWQTELVRMTLEHVIPSAGVNLTYEWLTPVQEGEEEEGEEFLCWRNAILLGKRGDINVLPFANVSRVPAEGRSVPWDAVVFKRAVYAAYGIDLRLPVGREGEKGVVGLPPFTVGYAKRAGQRSKIGWNVLPQGIFRRFSEEDEAWFQGMLKEETARVGAGLIVFETTAEEPFETQVRNMAKIGFVVGIHGANLVNAMFMQPLGVLMEIAPATSLSPCYIGGMNSGLKYMRHESSEIATPEESGCTEFDKECQNEERYRRVKLGKEEDRVRVRALVKEGIEHIRMLRERFGDGVPVQFNEAEAFFEIAE